MEYTATVDIKTSLSVDEILDQLEPYEGTIGATLNGYRAIFSYPAANLTQAIATAQNTTANLGEAYALAVTPANIADEQLKHSNPEPLVSVTQAAKLLNISPQAVTHRLRAHTLPGIKVGNTWAIPLAALLAQNLDTDNKEN